MTDKQDWPADLPGHVFVLRAVEKLVSDGFTTDDAQIHIKNWQLNANRRDAAWLQLMSGQKWAQMLAEIWSPSVQSSEVLSELFQQGTIRSHHAPIPPRPLRGRRPESHYGPTRLWVQVNAACVTKKPLKGRNIKSVTFTPAKKADLTEWLKTEVQRRERLLKLPEIWEEAKRRGVNRPSFRKYFADLPSNMKLPKGPQPKKPVAI